MSTTLNTKKNNTPLNLSYSYWACTTPNTKRDTLANGVFVVSNESGLAKVIVHVAEGLVTKLCYEKLTCFGGWGKGQSDRTRVCLG
jgi:hypothetical protein